MILLQCNLIECTLFIQFWKKFILILRLHLQILLTKFKDFDLILFLFFITHIEELDPTLVRFTLPSSRGGTSFSSHILLYNNMIVQFNINISTLLQDEHQDLSSHESRYINLCQVINQDISIYKYDKSNAISSQTNSIISRSHYSTLSGCYMMSYHFIIKKELGQNGGFIYVLFQIWKELLTLQGEVISCFSP